MSYPTLQNTPFLIATNPSYQDKIKPGDQRFWQFNMSFQNQTMTLIELLQSIREGYAWTAAHEHIRHHRPTRRNPSYQTTYRVKANVISAQLLALDCDTEDERSTFEYLLDDPFIGKQAALLHASASSNILQPRSRVIFLLDRPLNPQQYELALQALLDKYQFCDQSVKHAAAVFYGAQGCNYLLRDRVLSIEALYEEIVKPYQDKLAAEQAAREQAQQQRLAERGTAAEATSDQIGRYVTQALANITDDLSRAVAGMGLRHQLLFTAALKLGSLKAAAWLSTEAQALLHHAEDQLFNAAVANGYVDDYGEDAAFRTIDNGLDIGMLRPWEEPLWYAQEAFFDVGDLVRLKRRTGRFRGVLGDSGMSMGPGSLSWMCGRRLGLINHCSVSSLSNTVPLLIS